MEDELGRGNIVHLNGMQQLELDDQYDHIDPSIEYLIENEIFEPEDSADRNSRDYKHLLELVNSIYVIGCNCSDVTDCSTSEICNHGGNYTVTNTPSNRKELTLNSNRLSHDLIYECFENCNCSKTCKNRLVQYGPRKNLKIVNSNQIPNQKGLITLEYIPIGGFICEYAGEIITKHEAERRHTNNIQSNQMNYIICMNESCIDSSKDSALNNTMKENQIYKRENESERLVLVAKTTTKIPTQDDDDNGDIILLQTFIDPSKKGNIGRYLNHSCEPNCQILSVRVDGPVPKLGIFAKRNIEPYEELCFHYGDGYAHKINYYVDDDDEKLEKKEIEEKRRRCLCGSKNCEKFLPNIKF